MRNTNPIDDDEDDIREGSIHGMAVPLNESLFADIGTDDMSGFADAGNDSGEFSVNYSEQSADTAVAFDLDADQPSPTISIGAGGGSEEPDGDEPEIVSAPVFDVPTFETPSYDVPTFETPSYDVPTFETPSYEIPTYEVPTSLPEHGAEATVVESPLYGDESNQVEEVPAHLYGDASPPTEEIPAHLYGDASAQNEEIPAHLYGDATAQNEEIPAELYGIGTPETTSNAPALDSIGGSPAPNNTSENAEIDPIDTLPKITAPRSKPGGLLSKFTGKRDAAGKPVAPQEPPKEEAAPENSNSAALDSLGTASGAKSFDSSSLDSIGTKSGLDATSLDSIGAKAAFDASALDSIGTNPEQTFAPSALDAIGTKGGAGGFDAAALDAIGAPAAEPVSNAAKEKPATKGGLLGGKFGQRAKGAEKPKIGGMQTPTNDPTMPQKETGLFMLPSADAVAEADRIRAKAQAAAQAPSSFSEAAVPIEESFQSSFTQQPLEQYSEVEQQQEIQSKEAPETASAASSASFFDETSEPFSDHEHMPEIPGDEIGRLITDADNAYKLRQFKAAEPIFANVLEKLDKAGNDADPLLPYCLDRMADNFYQMKRFNESLPVYRRLLQLQTKISAEDRDMISTLYKIAQTSEALNLTGEADSMYKRAFRLGQQSLVPGDPLLAKVLEGYGTMLMRSEASDAPPESADDEAAVEAKPEKVTTLSPDELAALNALKISGGSEPAPIVLSGAPAPVADPSLRGSGSRERGPLRESEERTDRRASGPDQSAATTAGSLYIRLGLFIAVIAGLLLVVFNLKTDYAGSHLAHSKDFKSKAYKSLDGASTFTITHEDEAERDGFGKHFKYMYTDWNGSLTDDLAVVSGQSNPNNFVYMVPAGIKLADGSVFYDASAPERVILTKMRELGKSAQDAYKANGKYPEGKDLDKLASSVNYKNQFGDGGVTATSIKWPFADASQVFSKSKFDTSLEQGGTWDGEQAAKPGQIYAASSSVKDPDASVFYIHARDREGHLLTRADGRALVLSFKNGIDVTATAEDNSSSGPASESVLRISKTGATVTAMSVLLGYMPILFFIILTIVFLSLANKGSRSSKIASIGIIWAPVMVLLTVLMKLAPPSLYPIALGLNVAAFLGGVGFMAFKVISTGAKKPKKSKVEASSM